MTNRSGHAVPAAAGERTAATLRETVGLVGEPSDAERSRTLLRRSTGGALATMSTRCAGFPFGSLVAYAADDDGNPLLCLSGLAEHSHNLAADPRASLMVTAPPDGSDPLAQARVTLVGETTMLTGAPRSEALDRYLSANPHAFYVDFGDFAVYRLQVSAVRFVGGFGRMSWVAAAEYAAAEPDPLVTDADRILRHMNDDHADALVDYCRVLAGLDEVVAASMVGVDRYGMDILACDQAGERRAVRVPFAGQADTVDQVRAETVALLREARARRAGS